MDCAHEHLKKNEEDIVNIDIDDYINFMNEFNDIIKNNIKELHGRLAQAPHIQKKITRLQDYNKQAYANIMILDFAKDVKESIKKNRNFNFDKFYKEGGYELRFMLYRRFIDQNNIVVNSNGILSPENYSDVANFSMLQKASVNQLRSFTEQERFNVAYGIFKYYYDFLINAAREIDNLEKKLSSVFTFNKKAIRQRIENLEKLSLDARNILEAILITDLYKKIPTDFYKKIYDADPVDVIIFSETEAFLIVYEKIKKGGQ